MKYLTFTEVMAWQRARQAQPEATPTETKQPKQTAPASNPRDGYQVEARKGGWYALIGPDGQVGSSQRTEADAWALLGG